MTTSTSSRGRHVAGGRRHQRRGQDNAGRTARRVCHPQRGAHGRRCRPVRPGHRQLAARGRRDLPGLRPLRASGPGEHRAGSAGDAPRRRHDARVLAATTAPARKRWSRAYPTGWTPCCRRGTTGASICPVDSGSGSRSPGRCWRRGRYAGADAGRDRQGPRRAREADLFDRFFESVTRGLTTVLIGQRFSTVRRADQIIVLDAGRIVEDSGHADLVAAGGRYARMFRCRPTGTSVTPMARRSDRCRPAAGRPDNARIRVGDRPPPLHHDTGARATLAVVGSLLAERLGLLIERRRRDITSPRLCSTARRSPSVVALAGLDYAVSRVQMTLNDPPTT